MKTFRDRATAHAVQLTLLTAAIVWLNAANFTRVTLPKIKWGLIYGLILCTARAMESSAPFRSSGHIRDRTTTMPLHIEILCNAYRLAVASVLSVLALLTLIIETHTEWQTERKLQAAAESAG